MFKKYIDSKKEEIINSVCKTIQFPSISIETKDSSNPFGISCKEVLEYVLSLGESLGFRTKNIDGYCGYIEFGDGEELIGIIGHLDVVPADDTWTYPPFSATVEDNRIYGRGAMDDKGPVIASLYAMKAVMDTVKVKKRVRLILGLNEEKAWKCINYYKAHEEIPTLGFSPDADFPCIYAEKGIITVFLTESYQYEKIQIRDIDCHDNAINVVPKYCSLVLALHDDLTSLEIIQSLRSIIDEYGYEIDIYNIDGTTVKLTSYGTAAHAAHPNLGSNAISRLLVILHDLYTIYQEKSNLLDFFFHYIHTQYDGKNLNLNISDESGVLTLNVGNLKLQENSLQIGCNIRVPVHTSLDTIENQFKKITSSYERVNIIVAGKKEPLYIDKNDSLTETLCSIFNRVTKRDDKPIAIGGATYARAFPNCISFGANMPGHKDMCHQADEFISIDNLITSSKIYAEAIYELAKDDNI